ncbi:hypothetical protein Tco_1405841 [Tanacetum coccineum]
MYEKIKRSDKDFIAIGSVEDDRRTQLNMKDEGLVVHMLIEKKYPLKKEIVVQMLKLKLESEEESTDGIGIDNDLSKKGYRLSPSNERSSGGVQSRFETYSRKDVYGKSCHLPIELEHKAYLALKHANFDLKTAGDHRKLQLNELNELRDQAYENSLIYKERTKKLHDSKIKNRIFNVGDQVLLFNSRLKIFSGKLKTRWSGPFTITKVFPYGTIELSQPDGPNFKVNGHRVKHYFGGHLPPKGRTRWKQTNTQRAGFYTENKPKEEHSLPKSRIASLAIRVPLIDPTAKNENPMIEDIQWSRSKAQGERFLQNILDLYFKYFKLPEDVVNRILQVVLDLQHFKSSLVIFAATILQISSAIHHISNINNMYIKSYSFSLFSSLPGVLTPMRGLFTS